jgi:hypothetical protein
MKNQIKLKKVLEKADVELHDNINENDLEKISNILEENYYILIQEINKINGDLSVNYIDIGIIEFKKDLVIKTNMISSYKVDGVYFYSNCHYSSNHNMKIKEKMRQKVLSFDSSIIFRNELEVYYYFENLDEFLNNKNLYVSIVDICGLKNYRVGHKWIIIRLIRLFGGVTINFKTLLNTFIISVNILET